jgi:hypothetical protein
MSGTFACPDEDQRIEQLRRLIPDNGTGPLDEVVSYDHGGVLRQTGIQPHRDLEQDLQPTVGTTTRNLEPAVVRSVGSPS